MGELEFDRQQQAINRFIERLQEQNPGSPLMDLPVDLKVGNYRLVGKLANRYEHISLLFRYAELKGKDFLGALLHHLIINRIEQQPTCLITVDEDLMLVPDLCGDGMLADWLEIYRLGLKQPNVFFVEAALAYVKQAHKLQAGSRASKSAIEAASEQLAQAIEQPYEPELRRLYANVVDKGWLLGENFERQCRVLLQPIWNSVHR